MSEVVDTLLYAFRIYAVSFSELQDDLMQWRAYGGASGGYSIGFDFSSIKLRRTISGASFYDDTLLAKVIYNRDLQVKIFEIVIDRVREGARRLYQSYKRGQFGAQSKYLEDSLISDFSMNIVIPIADWLLRFKNPKFTSEQEWRLIRYIIDPDAKSIDPDAKSGIELIYPRHYRVGRGGLCSYVELRLPISEKSTEAKFPIAIVWQGPNKEPRLFASLIQECLVSFGYDSEDVNVRVSQVPTRF
jgi:hypothetical protein